jgi:hypothetical protein
MAIIFSDTFTGTNGAAWNATNWTTSVSTGSVVDIQSNQGRLLTGTTGGFADLAKVILVAPGSTLANFEVLVSMTFNTTLSPAYGIPIFGRASGDWNMGDWPATGIMADLETGGDCYIQYQLNSGTKTTLVSGGAGTVAGITVGQAFWCRFRVTGTSVAAKWWKNDGGTTPEPASWTLSGTQSTVTAAGKIQARLEGGAAASSITASLDNFSLDNTVGTTGVGWYSRGGSRRGRMPSRDFAHRRASF